MTIRLFFLDFIYYKCIYLKKRKKTFNKNAKKNEQTLSLSLLLLFNC